MRCLHALIEEGKSLAELDISVNTKTTTTLFIGTIQGLVMQSLLAGDVTSIRRDAPGVIAIYRRGIGSAL